MNRSTYLTIDLFDYPSNWLAKNRLSGTIVNDTHVDRQPVDVQAHALLGVNRNPTIETNTCLAGPISSNLSRAYEA